MIFHIYHTGGNMKKTLSLLLVFAIFVFNFSATACAKELSLSAQAYVLYCVENDTVLLSHNENEKMKPASTTKIMTTLLTLEESEKNDRLVEFSDKMTAEGSSMYLKSGDTVHLSDLAIGMMMASGNDAANAAAMTLSESVSSFAELMNKRAQDIGMKNTHFVTPSGLDDDNHYSTAYDMALLMAEAMKNESFADITKNTSMTVDFLTPQKRVTYQNHNRLLTLYEHCVGGKTGFTKSAGRCLVSVSKKDLVTLIAVTLDAPSDWNDHITLYDYGFEKLTSIDTDDSKRSFHAKVVGSQKESVALKVKSPEPLVVDKDKKSFVKRTVYLPEFLYAPVKKGDYVGTVTYTLSGEIVAQNELYAQEDADYFEEKGLKAFLNRLFR